MSEEPSTAEKLHQEYSKLVGLLGHNIVTQKSLKRDAENLEQNIDKILKKISNLPRKEVEKVTSAAPNPEIQIVEEKNGTEG